MSEADVHSTIINKESKAELLMRRALNSCMGPMWGTSNKIRRREAEESSRAFDLAAVHFLYENLHMRAAQAMEKSADQCIVAGDYDTAIDKYINGLEQYLVQGEFGKAMSLTLTAVSLDKKREYRNDGMATSGMLIHYFEHGLLMEPLTILSMDNHMDIAGIYADFGYFNSVAHNIKAAGLQKSLGLMDQCCESLRHAVNLYCSSTKFTKAVGNFAKEIKDGLYESSSNEALIVESLEALLSGDYTISDIVSTGFKKKNLEHSISFETPLAILVGSALSSIDGFDISTFSKTYGTQQDGPTIETSTVDMVVEKILICLQRKWPSV